MLSFDFISEQIVVGSCPKSKKDISLLTNAGITAIINLQSNDDLNQRNISFTELNEESQSKNIRIYRIPIIDYDDNSMLAELPKTCELLQRLIAIDHVVYVHCNAGIERAPTVVVNYLVKENKLSLNQAYKHIQSKRACNPKLHLISALD